MSRTFSCLLFALLAIGVYAQTGSNATCDAVNNNKFLGWLNNTNNTIVFASPKTGTFGICGEKWSVVGTCCNETNLKAFFEITMQAQKAAWGNMVNSWKPIIVALPKLQALVGGNRTDAKAKLNASISTNSSQFSGLNDEQTTQLAEYANSLKADMLTFQTDGPKCFNASATAKGKIFCIGCSANPSDGSSFGNDTSVSISPGSCNMVTAACFTTWRLMFKTQGMMIAAGSINRQRGLAKLGLPPNGTNPNGNPPPTSGPMAPPPAPNIPPTPLGRGVKMNETLIAFNSCNGTVTGTCTQDMLNTIIKGFFNFMQPEKQAMSLDDPNQMTSTNSTRLLQSSSSNYDGGMNPSSSGADITGTITVPTTTASIDTTSLSATLSSSSSSSSTSSGSSKAFTGIFGLIAFLIVLLN